ncbi:MAG: ABC transporter permease subunit, partial [Alphaproteobacteria bacterium]
MAASFQTAVKISASPQGDRLAAGWIWLGVTVAFLLFWQFGEAFAKWAFDYPSGWRLPAARWIGKATKWLVDEASFGLFTFTDLTRFIADIIDVPYRIALSLLHTGLLSGQGSSAVQLLPPVSWIAVIAIMVMIGFHAGGARLAALVGLCFGFLAAFGQWGSAMITLASIVVAVPIGVVVGLLLGLAAYRWPRFETALVPVLDLMQTIPVFAYLVPVLFFFGFGPTAAIVATLIYALPPMARVTVLALQSVPSEIRDLGVMVGCSRRQMTWKVMVPSAKDSLMVGVNQVIMLSLNMVIIASMIGAGGLGFDVLAALRRLDIGAGLESGLAIVALAVALDRLSQAYADKVSESEHSRRGKGFVARHAYLLSGLVIVFGAAAAGLVLPAVQSYPEAATLSTGTFWSEVVGWINVNFFDTFEAIKNFILLNLLVPFKRLLAGLPWLGVVAMLAFAGWRLGGARLALTTGALSFLIAATGQWEKAMVTVYLCGISVIFAALIGIPIGILAAERNRLWRWLQVVIDTLQT